MRLTITWKQDEIKQLQRLLATAIYERDFAERKLAELEQQIMVMDAENASLTRQLAVARSWSIAKPKSNKPV